MPLFKKTKHEKLTTQHIAAIENIIGEDQYVDYAKLLSHTDNLLLQLTKEDQDIFDQLEYVRSKLLSKAKENIARKDMTPAQHQQYLKESIAWMRPIEGKRKAADRLTVKNTGSILLRELTFGILKALPEICAISLTLGIDYLTPIFEKLIHNPAAHIIVMLLMILLEKSIFDKAIESWRNGLYKQRVVKDIELLKATYIPLQAAATELKSAMEAEPNMMDLFEQ